MIMHMSKGNDSETLSTHIRDTLRKDILAGRWAPGDKLQLTTLSQRYQTSSTVIREALTRLVGDRLVVLKPNRGFFMPTLSLAELGDITELRCVSEEFGIGLAIERGNISWESELIAAHHTLERTPYREDNEEAQLTEDWNFAHQAFHAKLLEACGVPVLIDLTLTLSDLSMLYGRWAGSATRFLNRDVGQEHRDILAAALDRDAERASRLLRAHYETTFRAIVDSGVDKAGHPSAAVASI
jgi:DNA-binding GntR family transcriptional regulator